MDMVIYKLNQKLRSFTIGQRDAYRRLKECLGNHWSIDLIRVGIYISELNDVGKRETIKKIRDSVYRKYGQRGIKIINMGSTGVIIGVIDYLSGLKLRKDLNRMDLSIEFDRIIELWDRITFFVKAEDSYDKIYSTIIAFMNNRFQMFFVFAYGSASINTMKSIAKLNNEGKIRDKRYLLFTRSEIDKAGKEQYTWSFELFGEEYAPTQSSLT